MYLNVNDIARIRAIVAIRLSQPESQLAENTEIPVAVAVDSFNQAADITGGYFLTEWPQTSPPTYRELVDSIDFAKGVCIAVAF